jgi:hypothetical protein
MAGPSSIRLPKQWTQYIKSGVLLAISLATLHLSVPTTPSALILNDFDLCAAHLDILE